jgi:phytoene desaturase
VTEIMTGRSQVTGIVTQGGRKEGFDLVISNADVFHTYDVLLKREPRVEAMRKKVSAMNYSMSLFLIYFGTNRKYSNLQHHNIIFGSRYRELLSDIFERGRLADDFSLYLHAPTLSDPSLAPAGCESFYVLSPVPHLGKLAVDWKSEGPRYAEKILAYLEKHYMPDLRGSIVTRRLFTPDDFRTELNSRFGSAPFLLNRGCCRAPISASTTGIQRFVASISSVRGPIRERAFLEWSTQPKLPQV